MTSPTTLVRNLCIACIFAACGGDETGGTTKDVAGDGLDIMIGFETDASPSTTPPTTSVPDASDDSDTSCPGCFGAPCTTNAECNSGYCLEGPTGQQCSRTCIDTCEAGYSCRPVGSAGGDPVFLCVYDHLTYCKPCHANSDCELGVGGATGARCVVSDNGPSEGSFCRTPCSASECPAGGECRPVTIDGAAVSLCRPEGGVCGCSLHATTVGASTDCEVTNAVGTCDGERRCSAAGLSACDAHTPVAELCNAQDDDCDGLTDEDFPTKGQACDGADSDSCADGVAVCNADGTLGCTDDAAAKIEICNGLDEDCDGLTDEDFPQLGAPCDGDDSDKCKTGVFVCDGFGVTCDDDAAATVELCNGVDDNCDGQTDEGFAGVGEPCDGDDADLCKDGHMVCDASGVGLRCDDDAASKVELCNGVDDDCDTAVDEGFEQKNQPCDGDDADGCKDGFLVCSNDGLGLVCNDDAAARVELCNELDDDCRNGPDDTFTDKLKPCDGPDSDKCADGVWVCSPDGTGLACTDDALSITEKCNDLDDDCDGSTDEDFPTKGQACDSLIDTDKCADGHLVCDGTGLVCDDDAASIVELCNGIDDDCDGLTDTADPDLAVPNNPNQAGQCAGTKQLCTVTGFVPSYAGVPGYGLAETPDGSYLDENCDGIDGDEARALFVKKGGNDGGACGKTDPCGTINGALAKLGSKAHIYVQAGTYDEVVDVTKAVEIYGGYDSQWRRRPYGENRVTIRGAKHPGDQEWMTVRVRSTTLKLADLVVQGPNVPFDDRNNGRGRSSYAIHSVSSTVTLERVEIQAGNAATGATGSPGTDASQSTPGTAGSGLNGKQDINVCDDSRPGTGGGGASNGQCSSGTAGGSGGTGGAMDSHCGDCGSCGFFSTCGIGPVCGSVDVGICIATSDGTCTAGAGSAGSAGSGTGAGSAGAAGSGGSSCSGVGNGGGASVPTQGTGGAAGQRGGSIVSSFWYGGTGASGGLGANGAGGGGGGGSGGCDRGGINFQNTAGAGGGGGGAGGCRAGTGGGGGLPGGASYAVFASGGAIVATSSRFVLGTAGGGGAGGFGGRGQPGGQGGIGGGGTADSAQNGGSGGRGADGGASGGGGGGAGGNAIGIYTLSATVTNTNNDFSAGSAGFGGSGGGAPDSAGSAGLGARGMDGRVDSVLTCASAGACGN